jgi:L-threonylcarbamoyladenylate synthase
MSGFDPEKVRLAADILRSGGVIIYPTETVFGIGCDPWNNEACERVLYLKRRESIRTMLLLADSRKMVEETIGRLEGLSARLADRFWPGPLTMILRPGCDMPEYLQGASGGVAFRVTSNPVAAAIIREFGKPIISTSANLSGEPPVASPEEAEHIFGDAVDMVIPTHEPLGGIPSTVIDLVAGKPALVREGAISFSHILEASGT